MKSYHKVGLGHPEIGTLFLTRRGTGGETDVGWPMADVGFPIADCGCWITPESRRSGADDGKRRTEDGSRKTDDASPGVAALCAIPASRRPVSADTYSVVKGIMGMRGAFRRFLHVLRSLAGAILA